MIIKSSVHNIFDLQNPNDYRCKVVSFTESHMLMTVEIVPLVETRQRLVATFHYVSYFQGWLGWKSADFRLASTDDYLRFIHSVSPIAIGKHSNEELLEGAKGVQLFTVDTGDLPIHIIAAYAKLGDVIYPSEEFLD